MIFIPTLKMIRKERGMIKFYFAQLKSFVCSLYCSEISKALFIQTLISRIVYKRACSSKTILYRSLSLLLSFSLIFSPSAIAKQSISTSSTKAPISQVSSSETSIVSPIPSLDLAPSSTFSSPPPLTVDSSSPLTSPSLDKSPNGVDIINIVNPDKNGISNNLYLDFNVKEEGVVFNNSTSALTPTNLAGLIVGNPYLKHSASLILNQVTSTSPSSLLGFMEIAGERASLLIANPNGITCKNCGFLNVNEATLTTSSLIDPSSLSSSNPHNPNLALLSNLTLRVERGQINLDSLNALGSQSLNLLSRSLKIDGEVYVRELKTILGTNEISLSDKGALLLWQPIPLSSPSSSQEIRDKEEKQQVLALDVSYLGRVYANSIYLVANEANSLLKLNGSMATLPSQKEGDGGFYLDVNGELRIAAPKQEENALQASLEDVSTLANSSLSSNDSSPNPTPSNTALNTQESSAPSTPSAPFLFSSGKMQLKAQTLKNEGYILSEKDLFIKAQEMGNSSVILSKGLLSLYTASLINTQGLLQGSNLYTETDYLKNIQGFILAKNDLSIKAKEIENKAEVKLKSELISKEHIYFMQYNQERRKHWKGGWSGRIWVSVLDPRSKDYIESIYEDKLESYISSLIYAGNTLSIEAQILNNYDGQIGGEILSQIKAEEFNNLATEAQRKIVREGRIAQSYPTRYTCGMFNTKCNATDVKMVSYNNTTTSLLPLTLPTISDNLSLAPSVNALSPFSSFAPKNLEHKDFTPKDIEAFIQSSYFKDRFLSFYPNNRLEALSSLISSSLSLQENLSSLFNQTMQEEARYRNVSSQTLDSLTSYKPFESERIQSSSSFSSNIFGKNILLNSRVLNNEGSILASELIFVETKERLQNTGSIEGGNVYLNSEGEISNLGGKLKAKENLILNAKEVNLESKINTYEEYTQRKRFNVQKWLRGESGIETYSTLTYQSQNLYSQSTLSGSNISITAATSLSIKASDLLASKNLSLSAKDISIQTLSLKQSNARETNFTSSSTSLLQSSLSSGGDLRVNATESLSSTSANLEAKENLVLSGKNIFLLADKEESSSLSRSYSSGSFGSSWAREERSFYSKEVGNSLKASNVILNSQENILSVGSNIQAQENIAIRAKNFTSLASKEIRENSSLSKDRGALGFSSSSSSSSSYALTHTLSNFNSKNLFIQTSESIQLFGADIQAKESVLLDTHSFTLSNVFDEKRESNEGAKKIFWGLSDKSKEGRIKESQVKSSSISANSLLIQAGSKDSQKDLINQETIGDRHQDPQFSTSQNNSSSLSSQDKQLNHSPSPISPSLTIIGSTLNIASNASLSSEGNLSILDAHSTAKSTSSLKDRSFKGFYIDFNRKFSAGAEFKDNENKTSTLQTKSVGSEFNIGGSLSLNAKDALLIRGSNLSAKGSIEAFASSMTITSGQDTFVEDVEDKQGVLRVGVEVGNAYADLAYATKDLVDASKAVDKARRELNKAKQDYKDGKISKEALKDYELNLALLSTSLLSSSTNLASSIASTASAASTSFGTGMYAGVSVSYQGVKTQSSLSSTTQVSSNLSASSISLNARDSITQASSNLVANEISYRADQEIKIEALANTQSFKQSSKSYNTSFSFGSNGGGGLSGGGGKGRDRSESVSYVGSNTLAQKISIGSYSQGVDGLSNIKEDKKLNPSNTSNSSQNSNNPNALKVSLISSSLLAKDIEIKAKDLDLVSLQDSESSESKSFNVNAGLSLGGLSGGGGKDKRRSQRQWVNTQAKILGSESVRIELEDTLKIEGGVIGVGEEANRGEREGREGKEKGEARGERETRREKGEKEARKAAENAKTHTQASNTKEKYQEHEKQKDNAQGSSSNSYANNTNKESSSNTLPTLLISAKTIKATHLANKEEDDSKGFYVSTSLGRNNSSIGVGLSGNTQISLKNQAREKEGIAYASIGSLGENAKIELKLGGQDKQTNKAKQSLESSNPPSSSITAQSLQSLQSLGINTNLSATSISTKDKVTRALNTHLSIDNNLLSQEGWKQIGDDFKHLGRNLTQVARGLKNNIVTQSLINAMHSEENNLFSAIAKEAKNYIILDTLTQSILSDAKLSEALNGLTKLSATEAQEVLQEVVNIAGSQDGDTEGFIAKLSIYNNEEMTKGYAYSAKGSKAEKGKESKTKKEARGAKQEEWIGFNTRTNNLTNPNEVINTLFHETSNKQKHHKAEQGGKDTYAFIRGKTAENIFALKNYANTNTNTLTNTEWNTKYQSSKVFKQGNQLNKETWQRNAEGIGERDNFLLPALRTVAQAGKEAIKKIARNGAKESAKESGKQASKNAQKEIRMPKKGGEGVAKQRNKPQQLGEPNTSKFGQDKNGNKKYTEFDSDGKFVKEVRQKGGHGYKNNTVKERIYNQGKDGKVYEAYQVREARPDEIPKSWEK